MNRNFDAEKLLTELEGRSSATIIKSLEQLNYQDSEGL
jgi:hypothetical protein